MNSRVIYPQPHHADKSWIMPTSCGLWVLLWCYCPFGLGWSCVRICEFTFCSFFLFFFFHAFQRVMQLLFMHCSLNSSRKCWLFHGEQCIHALFTDPQISLFSNFFIKNGSHNTIHTFKNYFAIVFSVSVFSFNKISSIQTDPICFPLESPWYIPKCVSRFCETLEIEVVEKYISLSSWLIYG